MCIRLWFPYRSGLSGLYFSNWAAKANGEQNKYWPDNIEQAKRHLIIPKPYATIDQQSIKQQRHYSKSLAEDTRRTIDPSPSPSLAQQRQGKLHFGVSEHMSQSKTTSNQNITQPSLLQTCGTKHGTSKFSYVYNSYLCCSTYNNQRHDGSLCHGLSEDPEQVMHSKALWIKKQHFELSANMS